uniref:Uncharacterized protein n=1 Tax=Tetranychus urticae TaxID=32264 RepID=T1KAZ7_TETUR
MHLTYQQSGQLLIESKLKIKFNSGVIKRIKQLLD